MMTYVVRRLLSMVVVMALVALVVFIVARVVPGDPAAVMLGSSATQSDVDALRRQLGLDQPLITQFAMFVRDILTGNLGTSIFLNQPVLDAIAGRAQLTLLLAGMSITISVLIGLPVGIISAVKRGTALDQGVIGGAMLAASLPSFWVGLTLIEYLAVKVHWFPVSGFGPPGASLWEHIYHLVLPSIALGLPNSAIIIRFTRSSMLDVLGDDYIRTARAKGLGLGAVVIKHALRNALIPILTVIGLTLAVLIGGTIVTETVFGLPGAGNLIVSAVLRRDYPVIQGALLIISGIYVCINLVIDLLYAVVDPRVRY